MLSPESIRSFLCQVDGGADCFNLIWDWARLGFSCHLFWFRLALAHTFSLTRALVGFSLKAWQVSVTYSLKYRGRVTSFFHGLSLAHEPTIDCSSKIWQTSLRRRILWLSKVLLFGRVSLPRPSLTLKPIPGICKGALGRECHAVSPQLTLMCSFLQL